MIATIDTNVLVSGTLFRGVPGNVIDAAIDRRFTLALSREILTEFRTVLLRAKFGLSAEAVDVYVRDLESHAVVLNPTRRHHIVTADPDDNMVVDCAVEAAADIIVSGDAHLIDLRIVEGIQVVTPADFLESRYRVCPWENVRVRVRLPMPVDPSTSSESDNISRRIDRTSSSIE